MCSADETQFRPCGRPPPTCDFGSVEEWMVTLYGIWYVPPAV